MRAGVLVLVVMAWVVLPHTEAAPNIIYIMADDLGWNDVEWHSSPAQIPTPNLHSLAKSGVILNNYHGQSVCTPTRSTMLSGRHVIHTGIYTPFLQGTALHLALNYTLLPEYLKKLGYATHHVGKWHLGQNTLAALPTGRGFDSYLGYWSGAEDYYSHDCRGAYDFNNNTATAWEYNGTYSTFTFTQAAVDIIRTHPKDKPMFLYLAFQNVHWPLEAPQAYLDRFSHVPDSARQHVCAMASIMDDGIGNITAALKAAGMMDDTLIIFTSDNGGPTHKNEGTWSDNYPLPGGKNTLWEGGTRLAAFVTGPMLATPGSVSDELYHASDWLPTLVSMASGEDWHKLIPTGEPPFLLGDGIDQSESLLKGTPSKRTEMVHECHKPSDSNQVHGNAFTSVQTAASTTWKIIQTGPDNPREEQGWFPPPGQDPSATTYSLGCPPPPAALPDCTKHFCLFNLTADPCEHTDVSGAHPDVVAQLVARLKDYQATAVPPLEPQGCNPVIVKGAWRPCDDP